MGKLHFYKCLGRGKCNNIYILNKFTEWLSISVTVCLAWFSSGGQWIWRNLTMPGWPRFFTDSLSRFVRHYFYLCCIQWKELCQYNLSLFHLYMKMGMQEMCFSATAWSRFSLLNKKVNSHCVYCRPMIMGTSSPSGARAWACSSWLCW